MKLTAVPDGNSKSLRHTFDVSQSFASSLHPILIQSAYDRTNLPEWYVRHVQYGTVRGVNVIVRTLNTTFSTNAYAKVVKTVQYRVASAFTHRSRCPPLANPRPLRSPSLSYVRLLESPLPLADRSHWALRKTAAASSPLDCPLARLQ